MKYLPEGVPGKTHTNLTLLHLSSNQLSSLPESINECVSLQTVYANGNKIEKLPKRIFFDSMINVKLCNFSNNEIDSVYSIKTYG